MISQNADLGDSLGPIYYPKYPQNTLGAGQMQTPQHEKISPMAPLQAPWPHLPPIAPEKRKGKKKKRRGRGDSQGAGVASTAEQQRRSRMPSEIRSFLESQR